jgi:hypothetical protein
MLQGPYFIWLVLLVTSQTILHGGRQHSGHLFYFAMS